MYVVGKRTGNTLKHQQWLWLGKGIRGGFIFPAQTARGQDPSRLGGDAKAPEPRPWTNPSLPTVDPVTHQQRHHASGSRGSAPPWGGNAGPCSLSPVRIHPAVTGLYGQVSLLSRDPRLLKTAESPCEPGSETMSSAERNAKDTWSPNPWNYFQVSLAEAVRSSLSLAEHTGTARRWAHLWITSLFPKSSRPWITWRSSSFVPFA